MLRFLSIVLILLLSSCDDSSSLMGDSPENIESSSWVFVANEGGWLSPSGTVSMIGSHGEVIETEVLGSIVQSLCVYNDKLIVSVNNEQKLIVFDIDSSGLTNMSEVQLDGLSPREMLVVGNVLYVTSWDPDWYVYPYENGFVKVFDLNSFEVIHTIEAGIMPEGMLYEGGHVWVANSGGSTINKISPNTFAVVETIEVGSGPQSMIKNNSEIYISRTFYDENWNTNHGVTKISGYDSPVIQNYGSGVPCAGSVVSVNNEVYRTLPNNLDDQLMGGIAALNDNLSHDLSRKLGSYEQSNVYHVEVLDGEIWFAITDYQGLNEVKVISFDGVETASYQAGISPGDFAKWTE